jgi:hypothetical protein
MGSLEVYRKVDSRGYDNGGFTNEEQIRLKNVTQVI